MFGLGVQTDLPESNSADVMCPPYMYMYLKMNLSRKEHVGFDETQNCYCIQAMSFGVTFVNNAFSSRSVWYVLLFRNEGIVRKGHYISGHTLFSFVKVL